MLAYLLNHFLVTINGQAAPDVIDPKVDPETGALQWCQLIYGHCQDRMIRIYVYGDTDQVLDGDTWNICVPLDKIVVVGPRGAQNPSPIGTGGQYYISFNKDSGHVEGVKEAFCAALNAAKSEVANIT